jgi:SAM-dependent methyltransferase
VVSFETIEHVADPAGTMAEIRRLLRPDGFLIMSSPNVEIYTNRQSHHNPFHVKELTRNEFTGLLSSHFPAFRIYGQRLAVASAILGNDIAAQPAAQLLRDRGTIGAGSEELPASMYFIAIAAVLSQNLPLAPASLLLSDAYDVYWATRDRLAAQEIENERLRDRLEPLQRELAALRDRHLPETAIDSGLFDESHYRAVAQQPDLTLPELVRHYFAIGEKQGLSPSDKFDSVFYGTEYPDVARTDIGLFRHYLLYGRDEGRWPHRR